jgi:hypothetical protein
MSSTPPVLLVSIKEEKAKEMVKPRLTKRRSFSQNIHLAATHPVSLFFDKQLLILRQFLRKSSARDKLLATIQYWYQLYRAQLPEDSPQSAELVAIAFEKNISDARKGFRLFKWIDEYGKIRKIVTAPSRTLSASYWKLVPVTMRMCAFGYYLVDNFIWFSQITQGARYGRRDKNAAQLIIRMKRYKNNFSLWRTVIALAWCTRLIGILIWYRPATSNSDGDQDECQIITTRPWVECLTFHSVLLLRGIMNGFILCKHLGINQLSNIWVGRLGMIASMLGMWKHWGVKKDYFVEFKSD